jgi:hypothetical protein
MLVNCMLVIRMLIGTAEWSNSWLPIDDDKARPEVSTLPRASDLPPICAHRHV